jgi:3-oxoacyl-[acyl-carrier protein] reductase
MSNQLQGKTAFVTGGTGGIGAAICARFATEGAKVIAADLQQSATLPAGVEFREFDVTSEDIVISTFNQLGEQL